MDETVEIEKDQAQFFRAVGKKRTEDWSEGTYRGTITLSRGARLISTETGIVEIR